ncbi:MAG: DUF5906 domain-containing protein [Paracoccaceae bacterium]
MRPSPSEPASRAPRGRSGHGAACTGQSPTTSKEGDGARGRAEEGSQNQGLKTGWDASGGHLFSLFFGGSVPSTDADPPPGTGNAAEAGTLDGVEDQRTGNDAVEGYATSKGDGNPSLTLGDLADASIWVAWREAKDSGGRVRKMPLDPATRRAAKADDPSTWGTREAARRRADGLGAGKGVGIGVQLGAMPGLDGWRLCGVDLDGCRDPETGALAPWASEVVERFASYAETSPSGTGTHVLFLARDADFAAMRDAGLVTDRGGAEFSRGDHVEIALFMGSRYFTVTGDPLGEESTLRPVSLGALEWLTSEHGPSFKRGTKAASQAPRGGDESGSGLAFKWLCDRFRDGASEEAARAAIEADDGSAGEWWSRVDDRQRARAIANARLRAEREGAKVVALFGDPDDVDAEIERLTESGGGPIDAMNRKHAVVALPSRTAVATFHSDRVEFMAPRDLSALYRNQRLGERPLGDAWLEHLRRRTYPNGIVFDPSGREHSGRLNLWRGWALSPDPSADCGLILAHIRDVLCDRNAEHFRYVVGWLAHLVQKPAEKPGVALVLKGGKGAGKDTLAVVLSRIIGRGHVAHIDQPERLTQKFNGHFATAILGHVEEAFWSGARDRKGILQALITSRTTTLERKGVDPITVDSFVRLLMTTNEEWAVPASADERRYAVFDVPAARIGDRGYFDALYRQIDGDGPAGFLAYLLGVDLSGFEPRDVPQTGALLDQKLASLTNVERWWFEALWDARLPDGGGMGAGFGDDASWATTSQEIERTALRADYEHWLAKQRHQGSAAGVREFGKRLKALCPEIEDVRPWRKEGPRPKGYRLPILSRCRDLFAEAMGGDAAQVWGGDQSHQSREVHE